MSSARHKLLLPQAKTKRTPDLAQHQLKENNDADIFCKGSDKMIACDNPECKTEWFHYPCVGLAEDYEPDEWYCRDCAAKQ